MVIKCMIDVRRKVESGLYPIKIRLTQDRKVSYHGLGIYIAEDDFDSQLGVCKVNNKDSKSLHMEYNRTISRVIAKCEKICMEYSIREDYLSSATLKSLIAPPKDDEMLVVGSSRKTKHATVDECFNAVLATKTGRTHGAYRTTLKWITQLYGDGVYMKNIDDAWLRDFESRLSNTKDAIVKRKGGENGLSKNSIAAHMKNLKAVMNKARVSGLIPKDHYPFMSYQIVTEKTPKRAMELDAMRTLFSHMPQNVNEKMAIDVCKMIFFSVGTSIKDLYNLTDFHEESMTYTRAKTGRFYNIYIHEELRVLFNEYAKDDEGLVFRDMYSLDWLNRLVNDTLGYLCDKYKIRKITTYSMRHSWATYASKIGIPKEDIIAGLGHGMGAVTDVYIDYDMERVKKANRLVIDYVLYPDRFKKMQAKREAAMAGL